MANEPPFDSPVDYPTCVHGLPYCAECETRWDSDDEEWADHER